MVEIIKPDVTPNNPNTLELNRQHSRKDRSASLHPGAVFQSNKLGAVVNEKRNKLVHRNTNATITIDKGHDDSTQQKNRNLRRQHKSVDIIHSEDDENENGTLLANPNRQHHVHLPKFSLSPPDQKVWSYIFKFILEYILFNAASLYDNMA